MKKSFAVFALLTLTLAACAPSVDRPSLRPTIVKVSEPAGPGKAVLIQGRYLGGPSNSQVIFNADIDGGNGVVAPAADVVSWTSTDISVKVPAGTRPTGRFLFVKVGGVLSNSMPYTVNP